MATSTVLTKPFKHNARLFWKISFSGDHWDIIAYVNTVNYWKEVIQIDQTLRKLNDICDEERTCRHIINKIKKQVQDIHNQNILLYMMTDKYSRTKIG